MCYSQTLGDYGGKYDIILILHDIFPRSGQLLSVYQGLGVALKCWQISFCKILVVCLFLLSFLFILMGKKLEKLKKMISTTERRCAKHSFAHLNTQQIRININLNSLKPEALACLSTAKNNKSRLTTNNICATLNTIQKSRPF